MRKGKSAQIIADELEEDIQTIQPIYDAAELSAPDYDKDKIYKKLHLYDE